MRHLLHAAVIIAGGCFAQPALGQCDATKSTVVDHVAQASKATRVRNTVGEIQRFNAWLTPDDRKRKYCKMVRSPFRFFRGTNHLFWRDLTRDPRLARFGGADTRVWLQGDLHSENLGSIERNGQVRYAMNDFDDAVWADYQLDVWRLAVSVHLVAKANGLDASAADVGVKAIAAGYLDGLERGAPLALSPELSSFVAEIGTVRSRATGLAKYTVVTDSGHRTFKTHEKFVKPSPGVERELEKAIAAYVGRTEGTFQGKRHFKIKEVRQRVGSGTGSLGLMRYFVLIEGPTGGVDDDGILDVKQQPGPAAFPYLRDDTRARNETLFTNHGHRAVVSQRALQDIADPYLGWLQLSDDYYSVKERSPYYDQFDSDELSSSEALARVGKDWGQLVAASHRRAGQDANIAGVIQKRIGKNRRAWTSALVDTAARYTAQVQQDYAAFKAWVEAQSLCEAN